MTRPVLTAGLGQVPAAADVVEPTEIELTIGGMTCSACAARVQKKLNALQGVTAAVNFATERASVIAAPQVTVDMLIAAVAGAGYSATDARAAAQDMLAGTAVAGGDEVAGRSAVAADTSESAGAGQAAYLKRRLLLAAIFFVPLSDISGALSLFPSFRFGGWQWVLVGLAAPVVLWAAWPFHRAALVNLRHGVLTMDTLVSLGIVSATSWSLYAMFVLDAGRTSHSPRYELVHASGGGIYLEVAAAVTTFLLAGRYFEARGRMTAGQAMRELTAAGAKDVCVVAPDGTTRRIPVGELRPGDSFMVRPGEKVAADGEVVFGHSEVDRSALTGESVPAEVTVGGTVSAGTIAVAGRLIVRAVQVGGDTQLAQLIRLVERAQAEKAAIQRMADRISGIFVPAVLVLAAATVLGWFWAGGAPGRAFAAGLAVLIIACPCALGLATPAALVVACGRGASMGIFIKGYAALESCRAVDTIVLDKTGTITAGAMSVTEIVLAEGTSRAELLRRAGAVEQASEHSVAAAIASAACAEVGDMPEASDFRALPGLGATGLVDGAGVAVGRAVLLRDEGMSIADSMAAQVQALEQSGLTTVLVGWAGQARGVIAVADVIKPSAARAIAELRGLGLRTVLLTGDNESTAAAIGRQAGVDEIRAGALPADKADYISGLRAVGQRVAMVGDGINDGPALAAADLALALGSGTDVAISAADVIVLRDDLLALPDAVRLARATHRVIRRNLVWAFGYNLAAIPLAAVGLLNPLVAAAAMTLSSTFVVANSLRLRKVAPARPDA
ncbi:MAG TPA: heavy metal translocating P-type ATPase [Streptosporangiaceae bacterium]|nr:heavy metal translocating P-type ATPase [Streptosporangiaceae bacterium]